MSYWGSHYSFLNVENEEGGVNVDEDEAEKELRESMSLTKGNLEELKECFKICDKAGKGYVTPIEFKAVLKSVGQDLDNDDLKEIFNEIDEDSNGKIDFIEFLHVMNKKIKQPITDEDIEQCFAVFDSEENGFLTIRSLERVFKSLGQQRTDEELKEMMTFIDSKNEDGLIDFEAFKNYLIKEDLIRRKGGKDEEVEDESSKEGWKT